MINAHEVLLRLVLEKLQESDPQFAASVRSALDRTLGRMSESRGANLTNNEAHREMVRITIRNIFGGCGAAYWPYPRTPSFELVAPRVKEGVT
jgi:hypothetical protein